jgi:hypothetical protein
MRPWFLLARPGGAIRADNHVIIACRMDACRAAGTATARPVVRAARRGRSPMAAPPKASAAFPRWSRTRSSRNGGELPYRAG